MKPYYTDTLCTSGPLWGTLVEDARRLTKLHTIMQNPSVDTASLKLLPCSDESGISPLAK